LKKIAKIILDEIEGANSSTSKNFATFKLPFAEVSQTNPRKTPRSKSSRPVAGRQEGRRRTTFTSDKQEQVLP
jgi:hypothetical protein